MKRLILIVLFMLAGSTRSEVELPTSRDLIRTLENLEMPPEDIRLWQEYLLQNDSVNKVLTGDNTLEIEQIETGSFVSNRSGPLSTAILSADDAIIPNTTQTAISWNSLTINVNKLVNWSVSDPTKVFITSGNKDKVFLITARIQWVSNATGRRKAGIFSYDADDVQTGFKPLSEISATSGFFTIVSPSITFLAPAGTSYFTVEVEHNAGVGLNLKVSEFGITWIH